MKVQILGSSIGGDVSQQYTISYVVNDCVAIDAGCLGYAWPLDVQRNVKNVFISHCHTDHTASLPLYVENVFEPGPNRPTIYGGQHVIDTLKSDIFNDRIWPDFLALGTEESPFMELKTLEDREPVRVGDLTIRPIPVDHVVPANGFLVEEPGCAVLFGCDSGPTDEIWEIANKTENLKAVYLEASFPNDMKWLADASKHLTPEMFLTEYQKLDSDPAVVAVHIKAAFRDAVIRELRELRLDQMIIGTHFQPYYH